MNLIFVCPSYIYDENIDAYDIQLGETLHYVQLHIRNNFSVQSFASALMASKSYDFKNLKLHNKCLQIELFGIIKLILIQRVEQTTGTTP